MKDWLSDWAGWIVQASIPLVKDLAMVIKEPPCKFCIHWKPECIPNKEVFKFCQSPAMKNDFKCFKNKEATHD